MISRKHFIHSQGMGFEVDFFKFFFFCEPQNNTRFWQVLDFTM